MASEYEINALTKEDSWRMFRIIGELVEGFDKLAGIEPALVHGAHHHPRGATVGRHQRTGQFRGHEIGRAPVGGTQRKDQFRRGRREFQQNAEDRSVHGDGLQNKGY